MKKILQFNIKNVYYALSDGKPARLGLADSLSLEVDYSEQAVYGDGMRIFSIPNDKGYTGSLNLTTIDEEYEIAIGRKIKTDQGIARIEQTTNISHSLYYELETTDASEAEPQTFITKVWLLGVTTGSPSQSITQKTDSVTVSPTEIPIVVSGQVIKYITESGVKKRVLNATGLEKMAFWVSSVPGDAGYATFGDSVPDLTITIPDETEED